jgi:hypothetical protein
MLPSRRNELGTLPSAPPSNSPCRLSCSTCPAAASRSSAWASSSCFSSHRSRTLLGSTRVCICCSFFVASCSVVTRVTSNVCNDIIDSPFSHPLRISDFDIFPSYDHSLTTLTVFAPFAPTSSLPSRSSALSTLPLQKLVYVLSNVLTLALGLWKCRSMGLLPTGTGDWLAFETRGPVSGYVSRLFRVSSNQRNSRRRSYCIDQSVFDYGKFRPNRSGGINSPFSILLVELSKMPSGISFSYDSPCLL